MDTTGSKCICLAARYNLDMAGGRVKLTHAKQNTGLLLSRRGGAFTVKQGRNNLRITGQPRR